MIHLSTSESHFISLGNPRARFRFQAKCSNEEWLDQPIRWKRPRKIFVCAHGDLFHEKVLVEWIDRVFAVMALCPQHTFIILTKRPERMQRYFSSRCHYQVARTLIDLWKNRQLPKKFVEKAINSGQWPVESEGNVDYPDDIKLEAWPLPNLWLGVSVEDQATANERITFLLETPAAMRFASVEPLLGEIDFEAVWHGESALDIECWGECGWCKSGLPPLHNCQNGKGDYDKGRSGLDWVIVGGESGPNARPMHPDWARSIRDQCKYADVPFFFKQWGEWTPGDNVELTHGVIKGATLLDDKWMFSRESLASYDGHCDDEPDLYRVGKRKAGRLLDGIEHNDTPEVRT